MAPNDADDTNLDDAKQRIKDRAIMRNHNTLRLEVGDKVRLVNFKKQKDPTADEGSPGHPRVAGLHSLGVFLTSDEQGLERSIKPLTTALELHRLRDSCSLALVRPSATSSRPGGGAAVGEHARKQRCPCSWSLGRVVG